MISDVLALSIPLTAIVAATLIVIYMRRFSNQERMRMIENGVDIYQSRPKKQQGYDTLKGGLFLTGIGLGFLFGYLLKMNSSMDEMAYFIMLFIFGGLGLTLSHFVVQRQMKKDGESGRIS